MNYKNKIAWKPKEPVSHHYIWLVVKLTLLIAFTLWAVNGLYQGYKAVPQPAKLEIKADEVRIKTSGSASWYRYQINDWTNENALVCAVREIDGVHPRYKTVRVTYKDKSVDCQVTDYGPDYSVYPFRVVDLSPRAFRELADNGLAQGVLKDVTVEVL